MTIKWTDDEKAVAVRVYTETANLGQAQRSVAREDGETPGKNTIKRWATALGHDTDEIAERADQKTQAATRAATLGWAQRRADMMNDMGMVADFALAQTAYYLDAGNPRNAKDAATCMAILVDKAQLLSGDATSNIRGLPWDSDAMTRVKELAHEHGENVRPLRATA